MTLQWTRPESGPEHYQRGGEREETLAQRDGEPTRRPLDRQRMARIEGLAKGLGWFSIGLGLAEITVPRRLARIIGVRERPVLFRALGLRELGMGAGILTRRRPAGWLWARVAGDALDLALLGAGLRSRCARPERTAGAMVAVAGVTALDIFCAQRLSRGYGPTEVARSLTISGSPEELRRRWREPQTLARIMGDFAEISAVDGDRLRWAIHGPFGRRVEWQARIVEDPPDVLRWESLEGAPITTTGEVRFQPAARDLGTIVTLRVRFVPPGGALGTAAANLLGALPKTVAETRVMAALRRFKSLVETGEIPTTTPQPAAR